MSTCALVQARQEKLRRACGAAEVVVAAHISRTKVSETHCCSCGVCAWYPIQRLEKIVDDRVPRVTRPRQTMRMSRPASFRFLFPFPMPLGGWYVASGTAILCSRGRPSRLFPFRAPFGGGLWC